MQSSSIYTFDMHVYILFSVKAICTKKHKGIVHLKMKICWKYTQPQAIQDEFFHLNIFGEI